MQLLNTDDFDKLSINEKRVAIAKDVIARINAGLIIKTDRRNMFSVDTLDRLMYYTEEISSLKEAFNEITCSVCAKGALVCSWIGNFNQYSFDQLNQYSFDLRCGTYPSELVEIFSRAYLDWIEAQFEHYIFSWTYIDEDENFHLYPGYKGDLKAIMENIVETNGVLTY